MTGREVPPRPTGGPAADLGFCRAILPQVSRTFALGIRLLPRSLSETVTTAYLLCRIADTIEDAPGIQPEERVRLLRLFAAGLEDSGSELGITSILKCFEPSRNPDEYLVSSADVVVRCYRALAPEQRSAILAPVREMCDGMAGFIASAAATAGTLAGPQTFDDLERYCYYVAGTVGRILTDLFRIHAPSITENRYLALMRLSRGFGLGLQLTNIVRDLSDDHTRGQSFIPQDLCAQLGISAATFLTAGHEAASRRVVDAIRERALQYLEDGLTYCLTLPRREYRIRLFCILPLYFAGKTLELIRRRNSGTAPSRVKMSRPQVYALLGLGMAVAPNNTLLRASYRLLAPGRTGLKPAANLVAPT